MVKIYIVIIWLLYGYYMVINLLINISIINYFSICI